MQQIPPHGRIARAAYHIYIILQHYPTHGGTYYFQTARADGMSARDAGRSTMEKFILGAALGMVGGALIVANNCKVRALVKKNGDELLQKAEQYIDKKLEEKQSSPQDEAEEM